MSAPAEAKAKPSVFVFGGNGFLGLSAVPALISAGFQVRCGRRPRSNVLGLRPLKVPLVLADLDEPTTLESALEGTHTVVHLAGHYPRLSNTPAASRALAQRQMQALLDASARANVKRVIYVSSTATVAPSSTSTSNEGNRYVHAPGFGTYHDVKWELEAMVDAETRFETLTVCPGACLGPHDYRLGTAAFLAATARGLQPQHPDGPVNVVDVRDVAEAIARLATLMPGRAPRRLILSARTYSLHALLELVAARYGAPTPLPALDGAAAVALADEAEQLAAKTRTRATLSRELVDLVVHGVPVDASLSRDVLGLEYRALDDTLAAFDDWAKRIGLIAPPSPHPATQETTP